MTKLSTNSRLICQLVVLYRIFDVEHSKMNDYSIACYQTSPDKVLTIETTMYSPIQRVTFI